MSAYEPPELLNCPCCDGEPERLASPPSRDFETHSIRCKSCGLTVSAFDLNQAIALWNRRVTPTEQLHALLRRMRVIKGREYRAVAELERAVETIESVARWEVPAIPERQGDLAWERDVVRAKTQMWLNGHRSKGQQP